MAARSFVILLAFLLGSCTGDTPQQVVIPDAGSAVGRACSVNAECAPLPCDPVLLICICKADSDCPGQYCDNFTGKCVASVPGCNDSTACNPGEFCNADTRNCEALKGFCQQCNPLATPNDPACGAGNLCYADMSLEESFCARACTSASDCPQGATCQDLNQSGAMQCWPAPGTNCKTFTGCVPNSNVTCNSTADCQLPDGGGSTEICDSTSGTCVALEQVCALGTVCDPVNLVCVTSCTVDADCVPPNACVNNICQPIPGCASDQACPANKVCSIGVNDALGQCVPFCQTDMDCPSGNICEPAIEPDGSTRFKCIPSCLTTTECPYNQVCVDSNGNLLKGGNDGGDFGTCQGSLNGQTACQITSTCDSCEFCGYGNTCQSGASVGYCTPCDSSVANDCSAKLGFPSGSTCLSLAGRDGNGNLIGSGPYYCGIPCEGGLPATYLDGGQASIDAAACPAGFVCAALENGLGYNCVPTNFNCSSQVTSGLLCQ